MNKEELKLKILNANKTYREGKPIMTDIQFDDLVEQYQVLVTDEEYDAFRNSLHEVAGKVKHPFVMGSLDKLKIEEPENIKKFIKNCIKTSMNVSAKVDGISCRLHYENGKLVSASTRGNGEFGEDLTDKIKYVKYVPEKIFVKDTIDIRGELVIFKKDFDRLEGFANARNACAGIMNKKYWDKDEIANVSFVCYTVLGPKYGKAYQFMLLDDNNFYVAYNCTYDKDLSTSDEVIDKLMADATKDYPYDVDGLVVCDSTYCNEEKYRPDACMAVKTNQLIATTKVIDIAFEGPSKDGFFIPVAILEPVQLGGCSVSRASCHNLDYLEEKNIKYGSVVKILKSGDIIPKIIEVVDNTNVVDIELPTTCTCCGNVLERDGINLRCSNKNCNDQVTHQIAYFIKKLGVKHTSEASLKNFKIDSFDALLKFKPNSRHKTEMKLADELVSKVFNRSKQELLAAMNFKGVGETLINKIVDFYGYDNLTTMNFVGLPVGIGELTLQKFKDDLLENLEIVNKITLDSRYNYSDISQNNSRDVIAVKNGMSVCFTGKLNTMSRTEAENLAKTNGFDVLSSVNKKLTYLVTNTPDSGSSKNKKAKEFGTKVITEEDFLKLITDNTVQTDISEL